MQFAVARRGIRTKSANAASIALSLALLPLVGACTSADDKPYFGATERSGKDVHTFYFNNGAEPEYLDPTMAHDSASTALVIQMFEGLTAYDAKDLHPVQAGAVSWDQTEDNRLFRFHLRAESRW